MTRDTFLDNLCQCFITLTVKFFHILSKLSLFHFEIMIPCPVATDPAKKFEFIFLRAPLWVLKYHIKFPHMYVAESLRVENCCSFSLWSMANLQDYDLSLTTLSVLMFLTWAEWAGLVLRVWEGCASHCRKRWVRKEGQKGVCLPCPFQGHFMWHGIMNAVSLGEVWGLGKPAQLHGRWLSLARHRQQCKQGVRLSALT